MNTWLLSRSRTALGQIGTFFKENVEWIAISISLGFIIWVVATLAQNPTQQRTFSEPVRVEFIEDAESDVVRAPNAVLNNRRVEVSLRAPRSTWERIKSDDIRVVADLRNLPPGTHIVTLEGEIIRDGLPGRVVDVAPAELTVELVEVSERLIQITPEISRMPPTEFVTERPRCEPQQVTVRGPAPEVGQVVSAITRIDLQDTTTPVTVRSPIVLFNASNRPVTNLTVEPDTVVCQVDIRRRDAVSLRVVPNVIGRPPEGYLLVEDFDVEPPEVLVTGDPAIIEAMNGTVTTEPINVSDQRENFSRNVSVILPDGVSLIQPTQLVTVNVNIVEQNITRTFTDVPIRVQNLDIGLNVELSPGAVSVDITGPQSIVSSLSREDIGLSVDLTGLGEGRHEGLTVESRLLRESLRDADILVVVQPAAVTATITLDITPTPAGVTPVFGKVVPTTALPENSPQCAGHSGSECFPDGTAPR